MEVILHALIYALAVNNDSFIIKCTLHIVHKVFFQ